MFSKSHLSGTNAFHHSDCCGVSQLAGARSIVGGVRLLPDGTVLHATPHKLRLASQCPATTLISAVRDEVEGLHRAGVACHRDFGTCETGDVGCLDRTVAEVSGRTSGLFHRSIRSPRSTESGHLGSVTYKTVATSCFTAQLTAINWSWNCSTKWIPLRVKRKF